MQTRPTSHLAPLSIPAQIPYVVVFTKTDKRKKGAPHNEVNTEAFLESLEASGVPAPPTLRTSTKKAEGRETVLACVAKLRDAFLESATDD